MCLLTAHFGARALAFGREAESVLRLLQEAEPPGVMLTLAFHNRSAEFGKQFHLTHFLPMYYTVRQRGINSQFWARYAERFPVEYRPGKPPASPPDWLPWEFNLSHLADADFVLIQRATEENGADDRVGSVRAEGVLRQHAQLVRCDGLWCLYRTARGLHSH